MCWPACPMCKKRAILWLLSINHAMKKTKYIYNLNWINSILLILIFGKMERGRRLPLVCPRLTLPLFNFEFTMNWRESTKKDFKLDLSLQKKIKNQDEEKKARYRWRGREIERWEMRDFSFVFEIYNLYFSIFQDNYIVLLMDFSDINFDFSIFQEWVNKFVS